MRKIMLSIFAVLVILALSSFSSVPVSSSESDATVNVTITDYTGTEAISASNGDGCLEIFMAWTDAMFLYAANVGTEAGDAYHALADILFAALMVCIMQ
ncbi:MAG: hypothetical protein KatS3mg032_1754 [Cyclobacteriaceae bacterium]|nr:MAG: hypothetical protein KatS3mg032_1754 [Cyclobacteriaceae bacterium]